VGAALSVVAVLARLVEDLVNPPRPAAEQEIHEV